MSIEALTIALHHSKAKGSAKIVLLGIANHYHHDDHRGAWPSQDTLARYANISDRGVRKCIDDLVALGEISVDTHGGVSSSRNKPNRYWITLSCPEECDGTMAHRPKVEDFTTGTIRPDDRNNLVSRPEPQFRRTLTEPKEKPIKQMVKAKQVPSDWKPSEEFATECEQKFPTLVIANEVEAFIDYHTASGKLFKDLQAAFRTWCRNAVKFSSSKTVIHKQEVRPAAEGPVRRLWVRKLHDEGEHYECKPGEFGCK